MMNEVYDSFKKLALAGVGAVALSADKAKDLIDTLVEKGEMTVEQGKVANQKLKHDIQEKAKGCVTINHYTVSTEDFINNMDALSEDEIAALKAKLAEMEKPQD